MGDPLKTTSRFVTVPHHGLVEGPLQGRVYRLKSDAKVSSLAL